MSSFDPNVLLSIEFWNNNMVLALTGITMSFFGTIGYKVWSTAFISNGKMRNKYEAVSIFLGTLFVTAAVTFIVEAVYTEIVSVLSFGQTLACVIAFSMFAVNSMIEKWIHFDKKSQNVYAFSGLLFLLATLFKF